MKTRFHGCLFQILLLLIGVSSFNVVFAGSLSGQITDHDSGEPLNNILVQLYRSDDPNWAGENSWIYVDSTFTDSSGNYVFTNLAERQYHVSVYTGVQDILGVHYVQADLYHVQVFADALTQNMDLELRKAGFITGQVTTDGGMPIQNARVVAIGQWTEDGDDWHTTFTDANGQYVLWVMPTSFEYYEIEVMNAFVGGTQFEAQRAPIRYSAALGGTSGPDFTLAEGGCIEGRIVNDQGVGVPQVEIDPVIGFLDDPDTLTDANGFYRLTNIPATNAAYAYIDHYRPVIFNNVSYGSGENFVGPFTVVPGSNCVQAPDMVMAVAGTIEGVVTDNNGTPIVGAEIEVEGLDNNGYSAYGDEIYTDAFGQYTMDFLPPGVYTVRASKDGWAPAAEYNVVVSSGELTDVDLVVQQISQVAVVSGTVINFPEISCRRDSLGNLLPNYIETDDENTCESIMIAFPGDASYRDQDVLDIDQLIRGFADVDDGYGDYFEIDPTETAGNYTMPLLPGAVDAALLIFYDNEHGGSGVFYDSKSWILSAGDTLTNEDFVFPAAIETGAISGDIIFPAGERFNPQRTLIAATLEGASSNSPLGDAIAFLRFAPQYKIDNLPVGTYTVRAISDGFVTQTYEGVTVTSGTTTTRDINLSVGAVLSGEVTDSVNGTPLNGARIEITENGKYAVSDSTGQYEIRGLAPGEYNVVVSKPGYATFNATQQVTAPYTTFDITLVANTGSITGRVEDTNGAGINSATVVAYNPALDTYKTGSTVGGNFTISDLAPGDYVLGINVTGYDVTVYPPTGSLTLGPNEAFSIVDPIVISASPPLFSSRSTVSESGGVTTLAVTIMSDQALVSNPVISSTGLETPQGCSVFNWVQDSPMQWTVTCEADPAESLVSLQIVEGAVPVIPSDPGEATFSFEVQQDLVNTSSTNLYNAIGGETTIMGTQDNTQVYIPPFALTGTDSTAVTLTVQRYGDPGDAVNGTNNTSASAVYDFAFDQDGVAIDVNHSATVTLQFEKPDGMTQEEFEADLKIGFFRVQDQQWVYDDDPDSGISNIHINWLNNTITFDVNHFTRFAAFLPPAEVVPGDFDGDGDVDRDDLNILLQDRNSPVDESACGTACDLDGDGLITVLDARKLFLMCTRPRCATE
ncbi:MAG: carboxypeptidase regulatory-like domain-containing protein [Gammaproteobacteria bacterium]|jgi:5-hydroxyisourate hydrolase-like protein (transthyretin family)